MPAQPLPIPVPIPKPDSRSADERANEVADEHANEVADERADELANELAIQSVIQRAIQSAVDQPQVETEKKLLAQIVTKDESALDQLYDQYKNLVYSIALGRTKNKLDAEDILLDVFATVWIKADTYKPELGTPKTWLCRIAANKLTDLWRKNKNFPLTMDTTGLGNVLSAQSTNYDNAIDVQIALSNLPPDQRDAIKMVVYDGLTAQEVAKKLNVPLGTIKSRIRLGMDKLHKILSNGEEQ